MTHDAEKAPAQAPAALRVEIVRDRAALAALRGEWESALARSALRTPFLGFDWIETWLHTIGAQTRPFVVLAHEGDAVVGIAPLCTHPDRTTRWIGVPQGDYLGLIVPAGRDDVVRALARTIAEHRRELGRIVFDEMPDDHSHWRSLASALGEFGCAVRVEDAGDCLIMPLDDPEAARQQYYKKNIKNYVNWFEKRGELRFAVGDTVESTLALLEPLYAQHVERWADTPYPSAFLREEVRAFYERFVRALHPRGEVEIAALTLDDEYLALYLYFVHGGIVYMYKPTFNVEHKAHSPGQVILRCLLDRALERGWKALDYGRGDESYKARFATVTRANRRVVVYRHPLELRLAAWNQALRRSGLVRRLRETAIVRRLKG